MLAAMSESLQDQLLKAGLVDEQSVKKTRSKKRKQRKRGEADAEQTSASQAAAQREADRKARARTLNRRQQEERQREAAEKSARQMVMDQEIARDGEERFQFEHNGRIRPLTVSAEQRRQLAAGELAIARTRGRYRLVPAAVVPTLRRDAPFLLAWTADAAGPQEQAEAEYPGHPVPDDLIW
jgi:hypothetical protein